MGKAPNHKTVRYGAKISFKQTVCSRQFPDCPETPNHDDCHTCPLWGTGESKPYKEEWLNNNG